MTIKRIALLAAAATAVLSLAACGGSNDEPPATEANIETTAPLDDANMGALPTETPSATPTAEATNLVEAAPVAEVDPSEQVQDDADATGMTARVSRDEAANETQPAE